jgi:hypothetical protein
MDEAHVRQVAALHARQLDAARATAKQRGGPKPGTVLEREFPPLVKRLDAEFRRYCKAYNTAIGHEKLSVTNHDHGITIECGAVRNSAVRLPFEAEPRRVTECAVDVADNHQPFTVQVVERGESLALLLDDDRVTEEQLVTTLLDRFTTKLTAAECSAM